MQSPQVELNRDLIISSLQESAQNDPAVLAMWLEGADATGTVDEYSDIDLCFAVKAGAMSLVREAIHQTLTSLSIVDLEHELSKGAAHEHVVFHLAGSSPYLLLDCNLFVEGGSTFFEDDDIEKPVILFDHCSKIRFICHDNSQAIQNRRERLDSLTKIVNQSARITKYVKRGAYLEAFGYYHKWLILPLIELLRMYYTPLHTDYYIVHISRHLPEDTLRRLEDLCKVSSLADIKQQSASACIFIDEIIQKLEISE